MIKDDQNSDDIGEDSTLLAPEPAADGPHVPAPRLSRLVHKVGRERVHQALFGWSNSSFEIGRYAINGTLGRGGMGVVFKAFDAELDRHVALKVLRTELNEQDTIRLRREAQAMAKLSHSNVVQVYEVGQAEGQTFVAMELVDGQTLRDWMRRDPRPTWPQCIEVFLQVGAGLNAAHKQGLIHRDFKPSNAIVDDEGPARVLDFGLARRVGESQNAETDPGPRSVQQTRNDNNQVRPLDALLTNTGAVMGTVAYMPPEQMRGQEADARSDQFSFCVALYEAVYGERPFEGSSMQGLMISMMSGTIRPAPKGSKIPGTLRAVLQRGLACDPKERWPSMAELLLKLERLVAPRRWRWLALGGGLALGLVGLGTTLATPQLLAMNERCSGARARLDGIWDDVRRQDVKDAVLGTELSYAEGTWERIEPRLDEYADAWVGTHTEVCEATTVHHEQSVAAMDLRMSCLQEHRTALRAAVKILANANADTNTNTKTVENAVKLVVGLPDLSRCDDVERLELKRQRMPPPEDPQTAEQVQNLRDQLADVEAMNKAGQYADALEQVEPVMEQAEALGYGPLFAEAKYRRGLLLNRNGQYAKAEQEYQQAHTLALEHKHVRVELDAIQDLTLVVGSRLARHDEGLTWGQMALALAKRSGDDPELAQSLTTLGGVFRGQGEYKQAELHNQQALQIRQKAFGPDHLAVASSLSNLGSVFYSQGKYEQAKLHSQQALQIRQKALGPDHPAVANSLSGLGAMAAQHGEYEQAKLHLQQALKIQEKALGSDHPSMANSLSNLGTVLLSIGENGQAKLHYQRALRIEKKALGPDHPEVAATLRNLGNVSVRLGDSEQAKRYYQRSAKTFEKALGSESSEVAATLNQLGDLANILGEYEQAKPYYQRALKIFEKALRPDHPNLTFPLMGLAKIAMEQRDFTAAREHAERAVSIREAAKSAPGRLAKTRFLLAKILWSDEAQRVRARELAEQAREVFGKHGKRREEDLALVETWLAEHQVR